MKISKEYIELRGRQERRDWSYIISKALEMQTFHRPSQDKDS